MTVREIIYHRLNQQQLLDPQFETPDDVVKWLGAVQAQDYLSALWAIGMRLDNSTESSIETAIAKKKFVRSWPMRGTLHFVPAEDLRWMLKSLTPRVIKRSATLFRKSELDKSIFSKSRKVFIDSLKGGGQLTREELYLALEKRKIVTSNTRGLHILFVLAQEGLVCFGPRKGKQQTIVLIDEWLPPAKSISFDEALGKLALKYFTSHGPATIHDLAWWAGLTQAEAFAAVESVKSQLAKEKIANKEFWFSPSVGPGKTIPNKAYLMSVFDEYGIAYKDRSVLSDIGRTQKLIGMDFLSMIVIKGKIAGLWKRTLKKDKVVVQTTPLTPFTKSEITAITKSVKLYGKFLELKGEWN